MKKIICPVDFSAASEEALKLSADIALRLNLDLCVLHVVHYVPADVANARLYTPAVLENVEEQEQKLKTLLESLPENVKDKLNYKLLVKVGFLTDVVDELADEHTLVVSATSGANDFLHKVLGTLTQDIFKKGNSPVLVLPQGYQYQPFSNIAFATDLQAVPQWGVVEIVAFAKAFEAFITFFNIVDIDRTIDLRALEDSFYQYTKEAEYPKLSFDLGQSSNPVYGIREYVQQKKSDLLVLTQRERSFWEGLVEKSVSGDFMAQPDIPLLLFHESPQK